MPTILLCLISWLISSNLKFVIANWWSLGLEHSLLASSVITQDQTFLPHKVSPFCESLSGLSEGQKQFCMMHPDHMRVIGIGAKNGINECQKQFEKRRWNCSTIDNTTVFGPVTKFGSREAAFAHAISSAGVSFAVARACRKGHLRSCGCSKQPRPDNLNRDWLWTGCGDNLEYGHKLAQKFVDNPEKEVHTDSGRKSKSLKLQARQMMNLHNNEAGRRVIYKLARVVCKCHGISGSCSLQTCWLQLPTFHEVGNSLRKKYESAIEVKYNFPARRLRTRENKFVQPTKEDLVYLEPSPDYCMPNPETGSQGTTGRHCNKDSLGTDGCDIMCCGRGYNRYQEITQDKCNCYFKWCCQVVCDVCTKVVEYYVCK